MPLTIIRHDITKLPVDAIVNAANTDLAMGGGVCGAIFQAAGEGALQAACSKLAPIQTGEAVVTPGFNLPARLVIHAAGPVYHRHSPERSVALLRAAYTNALKRAVENGCKTVAFPLISSGIYGYPRDEALAVATSAIGAFLVTHDMDVSLVVFDKAAFAVSRALLGQVADYVGEHYVGEHLKSFHRPLEAEAPKEAVPLALCEAITIVGAAVPLPANRSLSDFVGNLDESFSATLLRLIDAKGFKKDSRVYARANIDRRLFSKIRGNPEYAPSKTTVLAFAIALELSLNETEDLLARAGFALSHSRKLDVIVEYFITNRRYDIHEINSVLFDYDQPLLGGS